MKPTQKSNKSIKSMPYSAKLAAVLVSLVIVFTAGLVVGRTDVADSRVDSLTKAISGQSDLDQVATNLPEDLNYDSVENLYDELRKLYDGDLDEATIMAELKRGLAASTGDPYTEYFTTEEATEFQASLEGTFTGIGAELGLENEAIVVVTPLKGFPAEAAGIRPGDVIVKIDDEETTGFSITDAVKKIRGPEGTEVKLTVFRDQKEVIDITIIRAVIDIPSVTYEVRDNIGIISISQFSSDTTKLVNEAADTFKQNNIQSVVLDMRGNPGGFLDQAISVSGVWLDSSKTAVEVKRGGKTIDVHKANGSHKFEGFNTVVLINGGSASASEIVAGALKDNGAATIVGTKSYGKGSVQNVDPVGSDGTELLKVTTARWFTPNGVNIDKEGIQPDVEVERSNEDFEADRDPQLDRALELLLQ